MHIHINTLQSNQLTNLVHYTGIEQQILIDEALCLFLDRWEYLLAQDPYYEHLEATHYESILSQNHTVEIDLSSYPGSDIAAFLTEHYSLNTVALGYVIRKALALLFEGKAVLKAAHV